MECLKGEGLAEGGCHLYSFWETVMWLEWDFLGWGSSCLGVTSALQRVSFIHQMTRIEFFLWSVGGLSGVNRCSLPPPLGKLTERVASDAWLTARHTSADLFNCEPRKLKKISDIPWTPKKPSAASRAQASETLFEPVPVSRSYRYKFWLSGASQNQDLTPSRNWESEPLCSQGSS